MSFSIRAIILEFVAPDHRLSCSKRLWADGLTELRRRGRGSRESGAFILGTARGVKRRAVRFVYYNDLDTRCLDSGIVIFDGTGYGSLWETCRATGMKVVADVHTHGGAPFQSQADRAHPMVATPGHIALIVPKFASRVFSPHEIGIFEYQGSHQWENRSGAGSEQFFHIGIFG